MGRLMSIDLGRRRCGIAVTDSLRICATPLTTVATAQLGPFVLDYIKRECVDAIVVGEPRDMEGKPSDCSRYIEPALARLRHVLPPELPIVRFDERFTSVLAHRAMLEGGMRKSRRRDKEVVDEMAAAILLNDYLQSRDHL